MLTTEEIFNASSQDFEHLALSVFRLQYEQVSVFREYCNLVGKNLSNVQSLSDIPFLPIELFKTQDVLINDAVAQISFESSATTGQVTSKHHVANLAVYEASFMKCFLDFYGAPSDYIFLALLPSYLERSNSSLVYMMNQLIAESEHKLSGFFMNDFEKLNATIKSAKVTNRKLFLIGVTYALLDFAEQYPQDLSDTIIMETGGMKGRRAEILREEVHGILKLKFGVPNIHSEYGMTELLSQAYSKGDGVFHCPDWMKVLIRDPYDPTQVNETGSGGINIIDLANINSCSFIATSDMGRKINKDTFAVLGRLHDAEIRGCNLMYS